MVSEFFLLIICSRNIFPLTKDSFCLSKSLALTPVPDHVKFQTLWDTGYALFLIFHVVPNSPSSTEQVTFIFFAKKFLSPTK